MSYSVLDRLGKEDPNPLLKPVEQYSGSILDRLNAAPPSVPTADKGAAGGFDITQQPTTINQNLHDVSALIGSGLDTSQANAQRVLTTAGLGDWTKEEAANRAAADATRATVTPQTTAAMNNMRWNEGPENFTLRGLIGHAAQGVGNIGMMGGLAGSAIQMIPHPLAKVVGAGVGAAANALDIGGSSAYDVEQQGGTKEQQREAALGGAVLGASSGALEVAGLGKILDAAKTVGTGAVRNTLLKKVAGTAADIGKVAATGAVAEGVQEYYESGGQQVVENVALKKPTFENAHEQAMFGGVVGAFTGGLMGGGASASGKVLTKFLPEQDPNAANKTGEDIPTSGRNVPFTDQGLASGRNIDLDAFQRQSQTAQTINAAVNPNNNQGVTGASTPISGQNAVPNPVQSLLRQAADATNTTNVVHAALDTQDLNNPGGGPAAIAREQADSQRLIAEAAANSQKAIDEALEVKPVEPAKAPPAALPPEQIEAAPVVKQQEPTRNLLAAQEESAPQTPVVDEAKATRGRLVDFLKQLMQPKAPEQQTNVLEGQPNRVPLDTLSQEEQTREAEKQKVWRDNLSGAPSEGANSYYLNSDGTQATSAKAVKPSTTVKLDRPGDQVDSIVTRAVSTMHKLNGGEDGKVTRVNPNLYRVGDSLYDLENDGESLRVVPATGFNEAADVTVERADDGYRLRVDDFTHRAGDTTPDAYAAGHLKRGFQAAERLLSGKTALGTEVQPLIATFTTPQGDKLPVTASSLRSIGAVMNDRGNETVADKLANLKAGIAYTIDKVGPLVDTDVRNLIVADKGIAKVQTSRVVDMDSLSGPAATAAAAPEAKAVPRRELVRQQLTSGYAAAKGMSTQEGLVNFTGASEENIPVTTQALGAIGAIINSQANSQKAALLDNVQSGINYVTRVLKTMPVGKLDELVAAQTEANTASQGQTKPVEAKSSMSTAPMLVDAITVGQAETQRNSETQAELNASRRAEAARLLMNQNELMARPKADPNVEALVEELNGTIRANRGNPDFNARAWLQSVYKEAKTASKNYSGTGRYTLNSGQQERQESDAGAALKASAAIEWIQQKMGAKPSLETLAALYREAEGTASTDMPGVEGRAIKVRGDSRTFHAMNIIRNLMGDMRADPTVDPREWLQEQKELADAVVDRAPDALAPETNIDDITNQMFAPNPEDTTNDDYAVVGRPNAKADAWANAERRSTTQVVAPKIKNQSKLNPKVESFLNSLLAKLGIQTAFELHDSTSINKMPEAVQALIKANPYQSQFIALDDPKQKVRVHVIYIATKTERGASRTHAARTLDLAHEFGHFVQRVVVDELVGKAVKMNDTQAKQLLADLLGLSAEQSADPVAAYQAMPENAKDAYDEMFADRLAYEMLSPNTAMTADGVTLTDVMNSTNAESFMTKLGSMLRNIYDRFVKLGLKEHTMKDFVQAMTGRRESAFYSMVQTLDKQSTVPMRMVNRQQFMSPLGRQTQYSQMMDRGFVKTVTSAIQSMYGLTSNLWAMNNQTSRWLARELAHKTSDVEAGNHGRTYMQLLRNFNAALAAKYDPILAKLPVHHQTIFGISTSHTPIGDAFIDKLHEYLSAEQPLDTIPADLNYTVERTGGDKKFGGQQKGVTLNMRDTVEMLRDYFAKDLYAFETANGLKINRRPNYWPKVLTADTVRKYTDQIWRALEHDILDDQGNVVEYGWEPEAILNTLNSYINGTSKDDRPFAAFKEVGEAAKRLTGRVSLFDEIQGASHNATKTRKISDARWQLLQFATEKDPVSVILKRSHEAVKALAMDYKFGSWVVAGPQGPNINFTFSLMNRADYKEYVAEQYRRLNDKIVTLMGKPHLTDRAIDSLKNNGAPPQLVYSTILARKDLITEALNDTNMDPNAVRSREAQAKVKETLAQNYYSPVAKIEAALAKGEDEGDISQAQVLRIKKVILPAMFGRLGQDEMPASWRAAQAYLMTGGNVVFLPLAVLSSLAEATQVGIRIYDPLIGNGMFSSQKKVLSYIGDMASKPGVNAEADTMTHMLGLVISTATEHATSASVESEFVPSEVKRFNQKFFEVFFLKQWTDFTRRLAYVAGKDALRQYARMAAQGNPQALAHAKVLGLDINAANTLSDADWIQTKNFQHAIYTWIEEALLRPGSDTRPARMSDPRFAIFWYLKDFSWAMQARTLSYVLSISKLQPDMIAKMTPWIAAAVPLMIAGSLGSFIRDLGTNRLPAAALHVNPVDRYATAWDTATSAITRSGALGPYELIFQFFNNYEHRGLPWISQISPFAAVLQDMAIRGSGKALRDKIPGLSIASKPVRDALLGVHQ